MCETTSNLTSSEQRRKAYLENEQEQERLGDAIAELFSQISAASYRLLVLIRELELASGWDGDFRSCAHWLNWRVGLGMGAAREWVRVARALEGLPLVSESMRLGQLSFSKVRAITRAATPENEDSLLNFALSSTAAHTETLVRKVRSSQLSEAELLVQGESAYERRELSAYTDEDGMVVVKARLDPETGALFLKAMEAGEEALFQAGQDGSNDSSCGERPSGQRSQDALDSATPSADQRRADALGLICESALSAELASGSRADRYQVVLHVEQDSNARLETAGFDGAEGGLDLSAETSRRFCCDSSQVVVSQSRDGTVLDVGRRTRAVSAGMRLALRVRDGHCQFPGCSCRHVEAHHVQHWAQGGETKLDNLVLLCRRHHRSVHEGGYSVAEAPEEAMERWWFFKPGGERMFNAPGLPLQVGDVASLLRDAHLAEGIEIDAAATIPEWDGSGIEWRFVL